MKRLKKMCGGHGFLALAAVAAAMLATPRVASLHAQEAVAKPAAAPAGNAENGKKLFRAVGCYQCHGYVGQGGTGTAPRIAPNPLPWPALSAYVRAPKNQMPAFTQKHLPETDLADIYAYLKSIPEPPKVKDIPLLNGN